MKGHQVPKKLHLASLAHKKSHANNPKRKAADRTALHFEQRGGQAHVFDQVPGVSEVKSESKQSS